MNWARPGTAAATRPNAANEASTSCFIVLPSPGSPQPYHPPAAESNVRRGPSGSTEYGVRSTSGPGPSADKADEAGVVAVADGPGLLDDRLGQQGEAQGPLERGQHLGQVVVEGDPRVGLDVHPVAGQQLVVGTRRAALGDGHPVHRQYLVARAAAGRRPG